MIAGIVSAMRTQMTQRGRMLIVTLDDASAAVEVTVYSEVYETHKRLFKEDEFLAVQGKISEDRFSGGLRITAEKALDIASARIQYARCVRLSLNASADVQALMTTLKAAAQPEGSPVVITYQNSQGLSELSLPEQWRIHPCDDTRQQLINLYSEKNVQIAYE